MVIEFEKSNETYTLRDALHLPDDHTYTELEIEAMKQERFDSWIKIITTPVEEVIVQE